MTLRDSDQVPAVLAAGLPAELTGALRRRLPVVLLTACNGDDVLPELKTRDFSLLILDDGMSSRAAIELLREVRALPRLRDLPVLYCLSDEAAADVLKALVRDLRVSQVLFRPVDMEELARQTSRILGVSLSDSAEETVDSQLIKAKIADIWERSSAVILERLELLEQAGVLLLAGTLTRELRESAEREAHKLAGSLGTFGFAAASRFAREMEQMLCGGTRRSETQALRFSELVVALRLQLEIATAQKNSASSAAPESADSLPRLLVVDRDPDLAHRLTQEAAIRGIRVEAAADLLEARQALAKGFPQVVLLDLGISQDAEAGLNLLTELDASHPPVPSVVLTARDTFTDRVEVVRHGGSGFLAKSLSASEILDVVTQLLHRRQASKARVLAVDDDPQVLAVLKALLEPQNISLTTLGDPLQFWNVLEESAPDLILLDVDMPQLSGVELCRVVRGDSRRSEIPVIFLTGHTDADTVQRVFAAGADDFVGKPIVGPELLTRMRNRLERTRLLRSIAETDPLTGVANRSKFRRVLDDFLRLADRHGQPLSLAAISLDGVEAANKMLGYAAGDDILRRLGHFLRHALRSEDVVSRWGGGEFVVGMYGLTRYDGVQRVAELLENVRPRLLTENQGQQPRIRFSAGVAQYPDDAGDLPSLYRSACAARDAARAAGDDLVLPAGWNPEQRDKLNRVDVVVAVADEAQASLLLHELESRGYRARWLHDGHTATRLLAGDAPGIEAKVILLDMDLPGVDSLSLLKRLGQNRALENARVIVLSSPSVGDDVPAALALGACDHIAKPFSLPVVIQRVHRALAEVLPPTARDAIGSFHERVGGLSREVIKH